MDSQEVNPLEIHQFSPEFFDSKKIWVSTASLGGNNFSPTDWSIWLPAALYGNVSQEVSHKTQQKSDPDPAQAQIINVLFLASNPQNTAQLNLVREVNRIDEELLKAKNRDQFTLKQEYAVSVSDLQALLLRYRPNIVHFSGHGSEQSALIFENGAGDMEIAPPPALTNLFSIVNNDEKNIQCVVLNACYSEKQAEAISRYIPCVIGMSAAISDEAAIKFSASFYRGLGYGESVNTAFELGCNDIAIHNIPEEATPRLKYAPGIDPSKVFLTNASGRKRQ
jgi:hypothetical protein